jgi:hypothetical protein
VDDLLCFVLGLLVLGTLFGAGYYASEEHWRAKVHAEAVKAGAAEYVIVDPETGRTEFRWKAAPSRQEER